MPNRELQRIETNGVTLETVVEGDGPLVILLHGWPQCWYLWRHQIDPIAEAGFRVAVPNQRGFGGSSAPKDPSAYNVRELAADVVSVPASGLAGIKAAYRAAGAPFDDPALAAERAYSRDWSRASFDPAVLAANREAIQARGREQNR